MSDYADIMKDLKEKHTPTAPASEPASKETNDQESKRIRTLHINFLNASEGDRVAKSLYVEHLLQDDDRIFQKEGATAEETMRYIHRRSMMM